MDDERDAGGHMLDQLSEDGAAHAGGVATGVSGEDGAVTTKPKAHSAAGAAARVSSLPRSDPSGSTDSAHDDTDAADAATHTPATTAARSSSDELASTGSAVTANASCKSGGGVQSLADTTLDDTRAQSVWAKDKVAALKRSLLNRCQSAQQVPPNDASTSSEDAAYKELYDCASRETRFRQDGFQRAMTDMGKRSLLAWLRGEIFLPQPPNFVDETHSSAERDEFVALHRARLCPRLYARLPVGFTLPAVSSKLQLCRSLFDAAKTPSETGLATNPIRSAHRIECSSRSPIVEFIFVRARERDVWTNTALKIGRNKLVLRESEALTRGEEPTGYSASAHALLYSVHVLGQSASEPARIRAILTAATPASIVSIKSLEPAPGDLFGPHRWVVTFNSTDCPTELLRVRMLQVKTGTAETEIGLHHPRKSHRLPCRACLSVKHFRKDCKATAPATQAAHSTLRLNVEATPKPQLLSVAQVSAKSLKALRSSLAPLVAKRLRDEKHASRQAKAQRDAKKVATEAAAAAKLRSAEMKRKREAQECARLAEAKARREAREAVTSQIRELRLGRRPRRSPRQPETRVQDTADDNAAQESPTTSNGTGAETVPSAPLAEQRRSQDDDAPTGKTGSASLQPPCATEQGNDAPVAQLSAHEDVLMQSSVGLDGTMCIADLVNGEEGPDVDTLVDGDHEDALAPDDEVPFLLL